MLVVASFALVGLVTMYWMVLTKRIAADRSLQVLWRASMVAGIVAVSLGSTSRPPLSTPEEVDIVCAPGDNLCTEVDKEWARGKVREKCKGAGGTGVLICYEDEDGDIHTVVKDIDCGESAATHE